MDKIKSNCIEREMSRIPAPAKMDSNKSIYSNNRAASKKTKSHVCPKMNEMTALKNRISNLEKIIEELHSRNDTRDIEKLLQKNTIDHQSKLLEIIERNITTKNEMIKTFTQNHGQDEMVKNHTLLLDIRTNFIEHLLQNEKAVQNLLKEKQSNEIVMRQTEAQLLENDKTINILQAVIAKKDGHLAEMERMRKTCESKGKILDQNRVNLEERISNLVTENLRYRTLRSLTQV